MEATTKLPIWLQLVVYTLYSFLFTYFFNIKLDAFYEANSSDTSTFGSSLMCIVVCTIFSFVLLWCIGKFLKYNSYTPLALITSFVVSLLTILILK